jgi:hypothetical protein
MSRAFPLRKLTTSVADSVDAVADGRRRRAERPTAEATMMGSTRRSDWSPP